MADLTSVEGNSGYVADIAKAALAEISLAVVAVPAAWPIASLVYRNQCDPELIMRVGTTWLKLSADVELARTSVNDAMRGLTRQQWHGADRDAFDKHVSAYGRELVGTEILAFIVGTALLVVGALLLAMVLAMFILATILAAFAAFIAIAAASVVGEGAAASAEATATEIAESGLEILESLEEAIETACSAASGAIDAAMGTDVGLQLSAGNTDVLHSLTQATIDGSDNVVAGFLSKFERDFVGSSIKGGAHSIPSPGYLVYGTMTNDAPTKDDQGKTSWGTGGIVDNIWQRVFHGDAWNSGPDQTPQPAGG
jgi:hypothetical protein